MLIDNCDGISSRSQPLYSWVRKSSAMCAHSRNTLCLHTRIRGSLRLIFTWAEALRTTKGSGSEQTGKYLAFACKLSGVRGEINTFYTPRHKLEFFGVPVWQSTCRYCERPLKKHTAEGRCERCRCQRVRVCKCVRECGCWSLSLFSLSFFSLSLSLSLSISLSLSVCVNAFFGGGGCRCRCTSALDH
jgi:hypothetical protein